MYNLNRKDTMEKEAPPINVQIGETQLNNTQVWYLVCAINEVLLGLMDQEGAAVEYEASLREVEALLLGKTPFNRPQDKIR